MVIDPLAGFFGTPMYWLDGILLVGIGLGALFGARSGFLQQFSRIAGLAIAFYTAFTINDLSTRFLLDYILINTEEYVARILSFFIVFFAIYLAVFYTTRFFQYLIKLVHLDSVDRMLGAVVGGAKMTLLLALLCLGLTMFPHPKSSEVVSKSVLAPVLVTGLKLSAAAVPNYYREQVENGLQTVQSNLREQK